MNLNASPSIGRDRANSCPSLRHLVFLALPVEQRVSKLVLTMCLTQLPAKDAANKTASPGRGKATVACVCYN